MTSSHAARSAIGPASFIPTLSSSDNCMFGIADNCEEGPPSFSLPWKVLNAVYHHIVGSWRETLSENFIVGIKGLEFNFLHDSNSFF